MPVVAVLTMAALGLSYPGPETLKLPVPFVKKLQAVVPLSNPEFVVTVSPDGGGGELEEVTVRIAGLLVTVP